MSLGAWLPAASSLPQTPVPAAAVAKCIHRCAAQALRQAHLAQTGEEPGEELGAEEAAGRGKSRISPSAV